MKEKNPSEDKRKKYILDTSELNANHNQYKQILDLLDDGLMIINEGGIIREANKKTCEIFDLAQDDLIGKSIKKFWKQTKEQKTQIKDFLHKLHSSQKAQLNFLRTKPDSSQLYGKLSGEKLDTSEPLFLLKIYETSTKARHLLSSNEPGSISRLLFESANDAILIMDDEKFILCNQSALRIFGCQNYDDIIYHSPWEFSPQIQTDGKDSQLKAKLLINNALNGNAQEFDWMHLRKDGSLMEAEVSLNALEFKGIKYIQAIVRDVSSRNEAKRKIKEKEKRFRSLFNNINSGIALHEIILDETGKPVDFIFLDVNPVYEELTKLKAKDIIGKHGREVIPGLEQKWIDIYGRVAKTGRAVSLTDHSNYLDKWWEIKAFSPKAGQFAVVLNDITDRRINQLRMEKNKDLMHQAEEIAQLGFYERNWQTGEGHWSAGFFKLLGYNEQKFAFSHEEFQKFIHPQDLKRVTDHVERSLKEKSLMDIRFRIVQKNGRVIHVHGIGKNQYDKSGNPLSTAGIFRDITKSRQNHEMLEKFFEQPMNIHLIINFKGEILKINKGVKTILGYSANELTGQNINSLLHPEDIESTKQEIQKLSEDNTTFYFENRYKHKNGGYRLLAWSAVTSPEYETIFAVASDITESHNAKQNLEEKNKRFATLLSNLNGMVYRCKNDRDWTMEFVSDGCYELTGYKPEHLLNSRQISFNDLILPKYQDFLWNHWQKNLKGKKAVETEYEILTASGDIKWVWERGRGIYDEQGNLMHIEGIISDITERKLAEEKAEKLSKAVEQSPESIVITDKQGTIEYVNPQFTKLTGYTFNEVIGQNPNILQSGEHDKAFYKQLWDTVLSGNIWYNEIRNKKKDGELYWERASISPIFNNQNEITHFVAVKEDITADKQFMADLKAAKEAAEESEEKFRQLAESAKVAISIISGPDGKDFIYINKHWTETTGYAAEELRRIKPTDIIHPDMVSKVLKYAENRLNGRPAPTRYELKIIHKSGETRYLDFASVPIKYGDKTALLSTGIDITDKKSAQDRLRKTNAELIIAKVKAEESDRLKSAFLANMSHEIRTPMNGILGFAELLTEPALTGEQQAKYVNVILKSGGRMLNIINNLIDISKIEAGQMEVTISKFNIRKEAEDIFTFFEQEMKLKNLEFNSVFPEKDITFLSSDKEKVYAVITNLLKNAIKYTPEGMVEFGYEVLRKDHATTEVKYFVKDTGIGVPADRLQSIFNRFVQADIEDKKAMEGAGLGLAISKAYAEMLGGELSVISEPGKGSTFYFTVPHQKSDVKTKKAKQDKKTQKVTGKKLNKVLIAEDDEYSDIHLSMILKKFAGSILHTKDGNETVTTCRNNPDIDLVMMDIKMPGMNGYEATRQIREFNSKVIIIAQTAYALAGDREKAMDAGCNDYISKPIRQDKLREIITKYF